MPRFTQDDTEGYSDQDLIALNAAYEEMVYLPEEALARMDDLARGSWEDHCAETVQFEFDIRAAVE